MPGGKFVMAFEGTQHPEVVADVMQFLSSRESVEEFVSRAMFLPARKDLIEAGVDYPVRSDVMNTFAQGLGQLPATAYSDNYNENFGAIGNIVRDRVTQAITGEVSFDEAMRLMLREAEDAFR